MYRATLSVWDEDACRRVHEASLTILADTGVEVRHRRARDLCAAAGASVEGQRVRLRPDMVAVALATAPRSWSLPPRGGDTAALELRDGASYFGSGPDCPYVVDPVTGERRRARLDDVRRAAALAELLPNIDFVMSMGLPEDVANEGVDTVQFAAMLEGTRKPIVVSSPFGGASLLTMYEMAGICGEARSFACLAMSSPPLMLDEAACSKTLACADLEVPLVMAPAVSAGSQGPASLAGCVAVANAEVLAALVIHQLARPGAPFVFGAGTGVFNMRTFVDVYNSPDVFLANQAHLDLIRWYGLPSWSYAGHSDSKLLDEQWSLEVAISTVLGALSRATLLHDVGYLESGLQGALEGMVLGDELVGYARALLDEVAVDDEALALDDIATVGPGGSHLGTRRTRRRYRQFWQPVLIDQNTHDRWLTRGDESLLARLRARLRELLDEEPAFMLESSTVQQLAELAGSSVKSPSSYRPERHASS